MKAIQLNAFHGIDVHRSLADDVTSAEVFCRHFAGTECGQQKTRHSDII